MSPSSMLTTRALNVVAGDVCLGLDSDGGAGLGVNVLVCRVLVPGAEQDASKKAADIATTIRILASFMLEQPRIAVFRKVRKILVTAGTANSCWCHDPVTMLVV